MRQLLKQLRPWASIESIVAEELTWEEVFMRLVKEAGRGREGCQCPLSRGG